MSTGSRLFGLLRKRPKAPVFKTKGEEFKYWKRYVDSEMSLGRVEIHKPLTGVKFIGQKPWQWIYSQADPITREGKVLGKQDQIRMPLVEPISDWHYFKGDYVELLQGPDKGKIGQIKKIVKERNWVFVQGLNKKRNPSYDMILVTEAPLLINSEVKLVDPSDMKQTEIEWRYTEDGDKVRVSVRTGRIIPIDKKEADTWEDGTNTESYQASSKDMSLEDLREITFKPTNYTVEEDLLRKYNLYKPKKKRKMHWY